MLLKLIIRRKKKWSDIPLSFLLLYLYFLKSHHLFCSITKKNASFPAFFQMGFSMLILLLEPKHLIFWTKVTCLDFSSNPPLHGLCTWITHLTKSRKLIIYLLNYSLVNPSCPLKSPVSFKEWYWLLKINHFPVLGFYSLEHAFLFLFNFVLILGKNCCTTND